MEEVKEEALAPAPVETANEDEKSLVEKFKTARERVEALKAECKAAEIEYENVESKLIKLLEDDEKRSSARYEGIGHVTIIEGAAHASIEKGRQPEVIDYLKQSGRADMIKTTVHAATLSTYVRECLKQNAELPPGVTFYKPKYLNFYSIK